MKYLVIILSPRSPVSPEPRHVRREHPFVFRFLTICEKGTLWRCRFDALAPPFADDQCAKKRDRRLRSSIFITLG